MRSSFRFSILSSLLALVMGSAHATHATNLGHCMSSTSKALSIRQWSPLDWHIFARRIGPFASLDPVQVESAKPYPSSLITINSQFGIDAVNLSFDPVRFFQEYRRRIDAAVEADPSLADFVIWPFFKFGDRSSSLLVRPGIDPVPDPAKRHLPPGILSHQDWGDYMSRGLMPFDQFNWNHDAAHLINYALYPEMMRRVRQYYQNQTRMMNSESGRVWILTGRMIDESGQRIHAHNRNIFERSLPASVQKADTKGLRDSLNALTPTERRALAVSLVQARPIIMRPSGALPHQFSRGPNEMNILKFRSVIAEHLSEQEVDAELALDFQGTGFSASLYQRLVLINRILQHMDQPLKQRLIVAEANELRTASRTRSRVMVDLAAQLPGLLDRLLINQLELFILGYRAYSDLELTPEIIASEAVNGWIEPESRTARYLQVADPALAQELIRRP